jgi:hypothetical protein
MRPRPYGKRIGLDFRTVYRHINTGRFPAYKFGGALLLDVDECDAIIRGLERRVPAPLPEKDPRRVARGKATAALNKARARREKLAPPQGEKPQ